MTSLSSPLQVNARVVHALILRELVTRYGRHKLGVIWLFVEPMLVTIGITVIWSHSGHANISQIPIVAFAITGYSSVLLWRNIPYRCLGAITTNEALLYHRNIRPLDIYLSRFAIEIAGATMSFLILASLFLLLELMPPPEDLLTVMWGWFNLAWFGCSLGLIIGVLSERSELTERIWHPVAYLLLPLSGIGFILDTVPEPARSVMLWVPMINGIELVRAGYFGSLFVPHYDVTHLVAGNLLATLIGLAQCHHLSKQTNRR